MEDQSFQPLDDGAPIGDDEYLLRRVATNDPGQKPVRWSEDLVFPRPHSFMPSKRDDKGVSVFREYRGTGCRFCTAAQIRAASDNPNIQNYAGILAILTAGLRGMNLSANPDPLPHDDPEYVPGHALIPEINRTVYETKRLDNGMEGKLFVMSLMDKLVRGIEVVPPIVLIRLKPQPRPAPEKT